MAFYAPLVALLKADATVNALVPDRITPVDSTQGDALPYLVYRITTSEHVHSHGGASCLANGLFIVTCWADGYDAVWTLAEAVRTALTGRSGTFTSIEFGSILFQGYQDVPEGPVDGGSVSSKGVQAVFDVWYKETA